MRPPEHELWIDGTRHMVPHAVWAHFQTLRAANEHLVAKVTDWAPEARTLASVLDRHEPLGRWSASRKAALLGLLAVNALTVKEVTDKFALSHEELDEWQRGFAEYGLLGLETLRIETRR